ncbi:NFACT family protein [Savagea sp. SN6]|uniref:Rqc2 homolog RqcH n=1 Tax=Savagea serpentis TaxID=2785297 RepID=A0A8J7KGJ7_9BACL|nr:NFACT RNA binding domain-containing protein [Savagea serpentis]MBF4499888.1 NFACT family protein [Savagea serpentis]
MAFDGLFTRAIVTELQQLVGGRINRVHQPNEYEVVLTMRAQRKNVKLLLSAHPSYARVQLTEETITNPPEPTMFCTILRRHIESGIITAIEQVDNDRIIHFTIASHNEIGDPITRTLIMEVMGRHSNLMVVDPMNDKIIEALKHLPPYMNSFRTVLPGATYVSPPEQEKKNPFTISEEELFDIYHKLEKGRDFIQYLQGVAPIHATELYALLKQNLQFQTYRHFIESFETLPFQPVVMKKDGRDIFSAHPLTTADEVIYEAKSLGDLLDRVYFEKADRERVRAQAQDLEKWLANERAKLVKKEKVLQKEYKDAEKLDDFQLYGELLMAHHYQIEANAKEATVENYYDGSEVTIPLDPRKTAIENANRYYTKYTKAKNALIQLKQQMRLTKEELDYFETLLQQVEMATPDDIDEIREELIENGYMRKRRSKKKEKKKKMVIERYESSTGIPIAVGKNNKQNDHVTFKLASRHHTWLHTKDIPGSHVVILSDDPDETTLQEAAVIAAYFSKARTSSNVPVDYTEIRHVKKPSGAKPGFVNYFEQQTVFVTPDEQLVRQLKQ